MLKFGRRPARHTIKTMRSAVIVSKALDKLGTAPVKCSDWLTPIAKSGADWGMDGNDQWGDCVEAMVAHGVLLRTANTGTVIVPSEAQTLALYSDVTGFNQSAGKSGSNPTDQGTDETTMCDYMVKTGFLRQKADAVGMVDPTNLDHIKWCVDLFGYCQLGILVTQAMMDQFNAGKPWTLGGNQAVLGGHGVPIVDYDASFAYVVTWGGGTIKRRGVNVQPMGWGLFRSSVAGQGPLVEEAHAEFDLDWMNATGKTPSGLVLVQAVADLAAL